MKCSSLVWAVVCSRRTATDDVGVGNEAGPNQTLKLTFTSGSNLLSNAHCSRSNQFLMDKIKSLVEYSVSLESPARYESQMRLVLTLK